MAKRAITLLEVLISMAIFSLIIVVLALLFRSAGTEYGQAASEIQVTQTARQVVEALTPLAASAVPARPGQADFIYSPQEGMTSSDSGVYPSIYCFDFCSCIDFQDTQQIALGYTAGSANRRGTAPRSRYRVRFVPADSQLILERLQPDSPAPPALPLVDTRTQPRLLGRQLKLVTFEKHGSSVSVRITASAISKNGTPQVGLTHLRERTLDPDKDPAPHQAATTYDVFSTVLLPVSTVR